MYEYDQFGRAAEHGDLQMIQAMLTGEEPVPVDCICCHVLSVTRGHYEYVTPLLLACREGHLAIVQELIRAGADVNWKHVFYKTAPDDDDRQNGGSLDWVKRVFSRQPFINFTVVCTNTSLHAACLNGESPEVVEALLAAGADVNATIGNDIMGNGNGNGNYVLMTLARTSAPSTSQLTIARLLIAANCDVNQKTQSGDMALLNACRSCHPGDEFVCFLIEHGARMMPRALFECFYYHHPHATTVKKSAVYSSMEWTSMPKMRREGL